MSAAGSASSSASASVSTLAERTAAVEHRELAEDVARAERGERDRAPVGVLAGDPAGRRRGRCSRRRSGRPRGRRARPSGSERGIATWRDPLELVAARAPRTAAREPAARRIPRPSAVEYHGFQPGRGRKALGLARRTPVGGPVVVALAARCDPGAAARTGPPVRSRRRSPAAAGPWRSRSSSRARSRRRRARARPASSSPTIRHGLTRAWKQRLDADRVADPGDELLVEQRVADLPPGAQAAQALDRLGALEAGAQWIGAEAAQGRVVAQP